MDTPTLAVVNPRDGQGKLTLVFRPFTRAEADAFLASWCRVIEEPGGNTYAYAPEVETAKMIAAGPALAEALREIATVATHHEDDMRAIASAALRKAGILPPDETRR